MNPAADNNLADQVNNKSNEKKNGAHRKNCLVLNGSEGRVPEAYLDDIGGHGLDAL